MNYNTTSAMKDAEVKIMEDIKYGKCSGGEIFVEKASEVLKDFIHTRENVDY